MPPQSTMYNSRRKPHHHNSMPEYSYVTSYLRKHSNLPVILVVIFILVFAMIMYSEDIKALAEYSFYKNSSQEFLDTYDDLDQLFQLHHNNPIQTNNPLPISQPLAKPTTTTNTTDSSSDDNMIIRVDHRIEQSPPPPPPPPPPQQRQNEAVQVIGVPESCDITDGYWVFDNVSYPLYKEDECEFVSSQVSCIKNGRQEDMYQKWRWQPKACSLPRFDAKLFLERLRGKRLMFVGDSLNRNQWESMVCMVQSASAPGKKRKKWVNDRLVFEMEDYNATVEFYWAPFLVESNSDNPKIHSILDRIIKTESIEQHAVHWKDVDYLIFNTYIWWMNNLKMKVMRPMGKNWTEYDEVVRGEAYERVLKTWSNWVDMNIDPKRTTVFFMSMSPLHYQSEAWGNPNGIKCAKEMYPIFNMSGVHLGTDKNMFRIGEKVSRNTSRVPINFMDITTMSEFRKDAHTTVFTARQGMPLTKEQQKDLKKYADCIHWCVPGLPDTWNQLIYAKIISKLISQL